MKISPDVLKPHPLLSLLPSRALKRLCADSAVAEYSKGTILFREGEACDTLYLLVSGRCEASVRGRSGGTLVEEVFGPGDVLSDRAFLNNEPHRATVTVTTHCLALRIPTAELEGLFSKDPKLAGRFSLAVARRWRVVRQRHLERSTRVRRVVSLISLAERVDASVVAHQLAVALRRITGQEVLLVELASDPARAKPLERMLREPRFDGEFCFGQHIERDARGFDKLCLPISVEPRYAEAIAPLVSHCSRHYDYVLLHALPALSERTLIECITQTDLAYVLLQPTTQNLYHYDLLLRALRGPASAACSHVKPIVFADDRVQADEAHAAFARLGQAVHSFAHGFPRHDSANWPDRRFELHLGRLAREIARCRVGLALSSGGAKGLAHAGVIQVLEENGIEVDAIAGASMGAYVGSLWAYGLDGGMLEKVAWELESRWGLLPLMEPVLPPRRGFLRTRRIARRLRRSLGEAHFSDLVRPLRVVAARLETLERVVFASGDVVQAVEASIAMPGICVPVRIDCELFVDGGIADPLPVDVLEEMGIERIIAVNTIPTPEKLRYWLERKREQNGKTVPRRSLGRWVNQHVNYFAHGNVFDTMVQALNSVQMRVADSQTLRADVTLRPVAADAWWHDFTHPRKYIALGRQVAEEQLGELLALAKGTSQYEPPILPSGLVARTPILQAA